MAIFLLLIFQSYLDEDTIEELKREETQVQKSIENCRTGPKDLDCSFFDSDRPLDVRRDEDTINNMPRSIFVDAVDYD
jgi:hypothetical protein